MSRLYHAIVVHMSTEYPRTETYTVLENEVTRLLDTLDGERAKGESATAIISEVDDDGQVEVTVTIERVETGEEVGDGAE